VALTRQQKKRKKAAIARRTPKAPLAPTNANRSRDLLVYGVLALTRLARGEQCFRNIEGIASSSCSDLGVGTCCVWRAVRISQILVPRRDVDGQPGDGGPASFWRVLHTPGNQDEAAAQSASEDSTRSSPASINSLYSPCAVRGRGKQGCADLRVVAEIPGAPVIHVGGFLLNTNARIGLRRHRQSASRGRRRTSTICRVERADNAMRGSTRRIWAGCVRQLARHVGEESEWLPATGSMRPWVRDGRCRCPAFERARRFATTEG